MTLLLPYRRPLLGLPFCRNGLWLRARAVPSLDVPFADNKSLVDAITGRQLISYARAGSGTYTDSTGTLRTAAVDEPRFDHKITSTTTNLATRSEEFDNATWVRTGINAFGSGSFTNAIAAPDGTVTADEIDEDTSTGFHRVSQTLISGTVETGTYTASVYVKANQRSRAYISLDDNATGGVTAGFALLTQAFNITTAGSWSGSTASIEDVGNGWFRISLTSTKGDGSSALTLHVGIAQISTTTISYTGNGTAGLYVWGAQLVASDSNGRYVRTTAAAASFSTTESLGLLVEEQRTNSIRNNTMVGAIAGTPGTLPTNWISGASSGLAREIVGIGVENGIAYVDVRYFGTATSALFQYVAFEVATQVAATQSSIWTCSAFMKLVGGSLANINSVLLVIDNYNSSGTALAQYAVSGPLALTTSALITQRYSVSSTSSTFSNAATAFVRPYLQINANSGAVIDITLRIGLPQLEQGAFASSVIPTTTAAATRNADVVSITGTNFSSWYRQDEGTVFSDSLILRSQIKTQVVWSTEGGTFSTSLRQPQSTANQFRALVNNVFTASTGANLTDGATRAAVAYSGVQGRLQVGIAGADATGAGTSDAITLSIGNTGGSTQLNGHIRRIVFWPTRLPDSTLQAITQP